MPTVVTGASVCLFVLQVVQYNDEPIGRGGGWGAVVLTTGVSFLPSPVPLSCHYHDELCTDVMDSVLSRC